MLNAVNVNSENPCIDLPEMYTDSTFWFEILYLVNLEDLGPDVTVELVETAVVKGLSSGFSGFFAPAVLNCVVLEDVGRGNTGLLWTVGVWGWAFGAWGRGWGGG